MQIKFNVPSKDTPGYPRRLRAAADFQKRMQDGGLDASLVDSMIDFLSAYIEGEKDALWDCSENQFFELLSAVSGGGEATVPPPKPEASA